MHQPQDGSEAFSLDRLIRRAVALGERVVHAPERVETRVDQTVTSIQRAAEQVVFWLEVIVALGAIYAVLRIGISFYTWNLRRREVLAEERQAAAEMRQATALEGILAELQKLGAGK